MPNANVYEYLFISHPCGPPLLAIPCFYLSRNIIYYLNFINSIYIQQFVQLMIIMQFYTNICIFL